MIMKADFNPNMNTNFQAKVSPQLEKFMRGFINQGGNRIKNNYRLSSRIEEFNTFGFDEYTINLATKSTGTGMQYSLVATKNGQDIKEGTCLSRKSSIREIVTYFLNIRKNQFINKMQNNNIYGL
jgi:hypothetical protein